MTQKRRKENKTCFKIVSQPFSIAEGVREGNARRDDNFFSFSIPGLIFLLYDDVCHNNYKMSECSEGILGIQTK